MNCFSKISRKQRLFLKTLPWGILYFRDYELQNGDVQRGSNIRALLYPDRDHDLRLLRMLTTAWPLASHA